MERSRIENGSGAKYSTPADTLAHETGAFFHRREISQQQDITSAASQKAENPISWFLSKFRREKSCEEGMLKYVVNQNNVKGDNIQGHNVTVNKFPPELIDVLNKLHQSLTTKTEES